jgi:LysR family transcriptional activator of nhaA
MNPWINYHHLFYFKTIAEERTVSGAAKKLRIGQPTLSAQLKQFEENLGVALFERRQRRLILTEHGKLALDYAKNIFRLGSEMYEALHDRLEVGRPSLDLGALDSVPKHVVLDLVKQALKISSCQITLLEGSPGELLRELSSHRMDLLVTNFLPAGADGKGLFYRSLTKKKVAFYGAPKFRFLRKGFPQSLSNQPLIFPTYDSKMRQDLDHWAKVHRINLHILTESQDISVNRLMATSGMGIMPAASHTVSKQIKQGELVEIGHLKGVSEELFLVAAQRKIENPIASKLMQNFRVSL